MRNTKVRALVECAVMVALAFALSFVKPWQMPLGGSVTLCSMLPILLIAVKYGPAIGVGCSFVYSLTQLAQGFIEGDISMASMSADVFIIALLFDYVVPYTLLGLGGIFGKKTRWHAVGSMSLAVVLRILCHYLTGITIWAQWTPDGWLAPIYSAAYNFGYLLPDFAIALVAFIILMSVREMRKLITIEEFAE